MRFRNARVRTKITAMLVSLVALWAFAAWVTLRDGVNLLAVSLIDQRVSQPTTQLITGLERERRLTLIYLAGHGPTVARDRDQLASQRAVTDKATAKFIKETGSSSVKFAIGSLEESRIRDLTTQLNGLPDFRIRIDSGVLTRAASVQSFNSMIDASFRIFSSISGVDDQAISRDARTIIALTRAKEMLSREDALLAGALAAGRFTASERTEFIQLVGIQHQLHQEAISELSPKDKARYDQLTQGPVATRLNQLEDRIIKSTFNVRLVTTAANWQGATEPAIEELDTAVRATADGLVDRAVPVAAWVVVRLVLAGGLGLLTVIASVILSVTTARHLVRQLERLKKAAHELSDERLPRIVERLGQGEQLDVAAEAPPLEFGDDDIGQVGKAFNTVQETAIRVAVEQAELRRSIRDILLSLARRSQALVHRQLTLLDAMERREIDTEELEDLFRVDHLATRMRRNAENLIILSGSTAARGWRRPVPMVDVVRSAVAEVEDYTRVAVLPIGEVSLTGRAVGDLAHLLAELIENAVSFSPPYTVAQISGHMVASGYAIEIEDRGLGMSDDSLEQINRRIADPPEFNLSSSAQLGLYVVGRLAERYQVQVTLKRSPYGGTTAVVVIPRELIEEGEVDAPGRSAQPLMTVGASTVHDYSELSQGHSPEPTPVAVVPVAQEPASEATTPSGLPLRVPQASLAAPLREEPAESVQPEEDPGRSPEEIRKIVGAFQSGSLRGRSDATAAEKSESETE
ncbi:MAG: nitrate- and nitrite sensing domain-containing protein [Streptosporangiaceae bacterium]